MVHKISIAACATLLALLILSAGNLRAEPVPANVVVTDVDAKPIAGAKVYLCNHKVRGEMSVVAEGETNAEGQYIFPAVENGPREYKQVLAFKDSYAWGGNYYRGKQDILIKLKAPANVAGKVTDKEGKPVEGATVRPYVIMSEGEDISFGVSKGAPFLFARTDAEGKFLLDALPANSRVALFVEAPEGFATYNGDYNSPLLPPVDGVAITLNPESKIRGTARHETSGKPAVGVMVNAHLQTPPRGYQFSTTGDDGSFELDALNPGDYLISLNGFEKDWGGVTVSTVRVAVGEAETVEDVSLLWTEGVIVEGRIVEAEGKQPVRATAYLQQSNSTGQPAAACTADAEGKFKARVKPGDYTIAVYVQGYSQYTKPLSVQTNTQLGDILISKNPEIVVNVQDADGKPIKGVVVRQWGSTLGTSDDQGVIRISDAQNYGRQQSIVVLSPDRMLGGIFNLPTQSEKDVTWTLKKTGAITGTVQKEDGTPLQGVEVRPYWIRETGQGATGGVLDESTAVKTDAQGKYTIKGLPADIEYTVEAQSKGYGKNDPWNGSRYMVSSGVTVELATIQLMTAETEMNGRIIDPNGAGIGGVMVILCGQKNSQAQTTTDAEGRFTFKDLTPSEVNLTIQADLQQSNWREVMPEQFKDVVITIYPMADLNAKLYSGGVPPELAGVEWINGVWAGFEAARGSRVAVAFVAIGNPNSRDAIRQLSSAVDASNGTFRALLVHDASATADEIKAYLAENAINLPAARVTQENSSGWYSPAFTAWKVLAIPSITLIGADGKIEKGNVPLQELGALTQQ